MKTKMNLCEVLARRVYDDIALKQIAGLNKGKSLMTAFQVSDYIRANLDNYLSVDERNQIISDNTFYKDNEEMNAMIMEITIDMVGKNVKQAIDNTLEIHFIGKNPLPPMKSPQDYIIEQFYKKAMGGNL